MCHRMFVLFSVIDFIECVQYCIGMFISSTGGIMLSFNLISHCSEPRSDRCICASIRSRCQLIVGPPKLRPKWRKEITSFMATRSQAAPLRRPLT